jgi:hypothetical protein
MDEPRIDDPDAGVALAVGEVARPSRAMVVAPDASG